MNGAIGLNIYPPFVRDSESITSEDLLRHIDYILNKTGENVLGMGTDFDGISKSPKDLEDISKLPKFYDLVSKEFGEEIEYSIKICRSFLWRICKLFYFTVNLLLELLTIIIKV